MELTPELWYWMEQSIVPIFTFIAGGLLGHWLAIHRDRRKEFNAVADPLALVLDDQESMPSTDVEIDFREVRRHFTGWSLWFFDRAVSEYYRSLSFENLERNGEYDYIEDNERVREAARRLLWWLRRR